MNISATVKHYAVMIFILSTVILTFGTILLPLPREILPLLMVFIPSIVALILVATTEGKQSLRSLLGTLRQRVSLKWVVAALGGALVLRLGVSLLALLLGWASGLQVGALTPLLIMFFIFAAGEELGWRGYALPRLLKTYSPLSASLILGIPWAFLLLALLLPGMMNEGVPAISQLFIMVALSVLTTWVYLGGGNSVLAATLLHGGQSAFAILIVNVGIDPAQSAWLMAVVYAAVAVMVVMTNLPMWLSHRPSQKTPLRAGQQA
jgi:membrane protease YdiL (CAAX protease family)